MKKPIYVTCAVLAGCLTLLSAGCGNSTDTTAADKAVFTYDECDGGVMLLQYDYDETIASGNGSGKLMIDIPSEIDGKRVVKLGEYLMKEVPDTYDIAVTVPATVKEIDDYHGYVSSVTVDEANENYSSEDGALYNKDKTKLLYFRRSRLEKQPIVFRVPDSVEYIADTYIYYYGETVLGTECVDIYIGKNVKQIDAWIRNSDFWTYYRYHVYQDSYADEWLKQEGIERTDYVTFQ